MNLAKQVVENSQSFDWRGPYHSLTRVASNSVEVIRSHTDWSSVVGKKEVHDMRNNNLADLFPKPRAILERVLGGLSDSGNSGSVPKKVIGPSL